METAMEQPEIPQLKDVQQNATSDASNQTTVGAVPLPAINSFTNAEEIVQLLPIRKKTHL
jgi:hypothetical protein